MFDLSLQQILLRAGAFLVVIAIHGLALAGIARVLGDRGPGYDGRLTPSPLSHLDLIALVGAVLFRLGWIRPIAIDPAQLRLGRFGLVVCVIGSLAMTLVAVALLQKLRIIAITTLPAGGADVVTNLLATTGQLGVWFAILNLLPLPPLTGAHLLVAIAPRLRPRLRQYHLYAVALLAALAATGVLTTVLRPAYDVIAPFTTAP